jgi:hypothetical protein
MVRPFRCPILQFIVPLHPAESFHLCLIKEPFAIIADFVNIKIAGKQIGSSAWLAEMELESLRYGYNSGLGRDQDE